MASSGKKKKTTMAKLARENKLRERRVDKQAKRDARKASAEQLDSTKGALDATVEAEHLGEPQLDTPARAAM